MGGAIGGNCETGSSGIEIAPTSVIRIATTAAKIGRSTKNATKPGARGPAVSEVSGDRGGADKRLPPCGAEGRGSDARCRAYQVTRSRAASRSGRSRRRDVAALRAALCSATWRRKRASCSAGQTAAKSLYIAGNERAPSGSTTHGSLLRVKMCTSGAYGVGLVERRAAHEQRVAGRRVVAAPQRRAARAAEAPRRGPRRCRLSARRSAARRRTARRTCRSIHRFSTNGAPREALAVAAVAGVHDQRLLGEPVTNRPARTAAFAHRFALRRTRSTAGRGESLENLAAVVSASRGRRPGPRPFPRAVRLLRGIWIAVHRAADRAHGRTISPRAARSPSSSAAGRRIPRKDALSLRVAGALHHATLVGATPSSRRSYPAARADWSMDEVWPSARAFLARERAAVAEFIRSAPQTNETRRSIALLAGFLAFAHEHAGPIETLEIGASAGLNLHWDRFAYRTASWSWGGDSPVVIDAEWKGAAPPLAATHRRAPPRGVGSESARHRRSGRAPAPQVLRLGRPARPPRALRRRRRARARRRRARRARRRRGVARRAAAAARARRRHGRLPLDLPAVPAARDARRDRGRDRVGGRRATPAAPLAWLRLEPEAVLGGPLDSVRMLLDLTIWPGGERRILAATDGHVRSVEML